MSEISSICLFLVTHLNHELTRAVYELRVWLRRARSAENPLEPPNIVAMVTLFWKSEFITISPFLREIYDG